MSDLVFTIETASSAWKEGQSKAPFTAIRVAMQCTGAKWEDGETSTTANVSTAIFAYMKKDGEYVFSHVCSGVDMLDISTSEGGPWKRSDSIDILFPTIEIAEEAVKKIKSDIAYLTNEIESYTTLVGHTVSEIT